MPLRKISNLPEYSCRDREHYPPSHIVLGDGVYEHECPSCGAKRMFRVSNPKLMVGSR